MEEIKLELEARLQIWQEHNRKEKQEYMDSIQKQIDEIANQVHELNGQISRLNEEKNQILKSRRPKEKVEAILDLVQELEELESKPVLFRWTRAYVGRDQRNRMYQQIKNKMNDFLEFDFHEYDIYFGKYMDQTSETHQKIEELIQDLRDFLSNVSYQKSQWNEDRLSMLKKNRNEMLSKQKQLEKQLSMYVPSPEYIEFKKVYEAFMKEYEKEDV